MRPFPSPSDYGSWDELPECPAEAELDLSNPDVKDALQRREVLIALWREYHDYPHGTWREELIDAHPEHAAAWRNWLLRRAWEGVNFINGSVRRWSTAS